MKILLLGKNGQVGWELQRSLAVLGEVIALDRDSAIFSADLSDPEALRKTIQEVHPQVVVNAAAYTAVDQAESEPDLVFTINARAAGVIAEEAARLDAWLVHYSTDYVFDGSGDQPWSETDETGPLSVYGASKLEGEKLILESGVKHLLLRTSWVYGAHGNNFIKTILRLGSQRPQLQVVSDQIGTPTGAELLADATAQALRQAVPGSPAFSGTYHVAAAGRTSWYEYAQLILDTAGSIGTRSDFAQVQPIASADYPQTATRPLNSQFNCERFVTTFGLQLPPWQDGVERVVREILSPR